MEYCPEFLVTLDRRLLKKLDNVQLGALRLCQGLPPERPVQHAAVEVKIGVPPPDLRRMELAARQAQRWLRQSTTVGAGGARPSHQLLGVRFAAVVKEPAWDPPSYWVSPKPASGLMSPVSTDGVTRAGPLYAVKAISLALDMPADPRCMEPDRTRRDRCSKRVQVVANDPEGVVGHSDWPVLGSASTRDEAAMAKARKFGTEQEDGYRAMILDQCAGQGTMCYCDGSVTPFLTEEVRRQASAGQRIDVTGHEVCTGRLQSRQQPSMSRGPKAAGAAIVGTVWTGNVWAEDRDWAAAI